MKKLERPASLDRLTTKKSKADLWYEETLAEMRYLIHWRKNQLKQGGHK
jgi:hypothetical protein